MLLRMKVYYICNCTLFHKQPVYETRIRKSGGRVMGWFLFIPVPDTETLKSMKRREHQLQHSKCAQRAYSLACSDRRAISHYLQLRVVREFGLPDSTADVLGSASLYYQEDSPERETRIPAYRHYHTSQPMTHYQQHSQCVPASYRHTHHPIHTRSPATPRTPSRHICPIQVCLLLIQQ